MQFVSATSTISDVETALENITGSIKAQLDGKSVDMVLLFITEPHIHNAELIAEIIQEQLNPTTWIGASGESIIGSTMEIEQTHGITCIAAHLPEVELHPFRIDDENWGPTLMTLDGLHHAVQNPEDPKVFITIADPFSTPAQQYLDAFNSYYEGIPVIGGMASAARQPRQNVMFFNGEVHRTGALGFALSGNIDVDIVVSQGCRPVGQAFTVEEVENNVLIQMDGLPPLIQLQSVFDTLPENEQRLLQNGLFIGRAIDSGNETLGRGDFLVRGVMGVDNQHGAMAVGDMLNEGEKVQFHVRDATTAVEDLSLMLAPQAFYDAPAGALLFSCNGRGSRLFDMPNTDVNTITDSIGEVPMAGFFAAGEIGPIGGTNFLHGHTASLVMFRPATQETDA